jgi:hypothetical protein
MSTPSSAHTQFQQNAMRNALIKGFMRIESIICLAIGIGIAILCLLDIFWLPEMWWLWLLFGFAGAGIIAFANTRDKKAVHKIKEDIVSDEINSNDLQVSELQAGVSRASYQHKSIQKMIAARTEDFGQMNASLDEWLQRCYGVSRGLDTILRHPRVLEHFYSVMDAGEVKSANLDSIAAFNNAAAIAIGGQTDRALDEDYNKLIFARDAVAQVRESLNQTIDHVVSVSEVLRHTRAMTLGPEHITQMNAMLQSEIQMLGETQRVVYKLGGAYEVPLN